MIAQTYLNLLLSPDEVSVLLNKVFTFGIYYSFRLETAVQNNAQMI